MSYPPPHSPPESASLAVKVALLSRPASYPEPTTHVEVRETHMSWVFLTERYAYKLKKPMRYPYLDFSTLARRRHNCEEEVRLNRRLAPDVYLGVVALTRDATGQLTLEGAGEPVEWLVKMRRLPADCLLDVAIGARRVPPDGLARAAQRLAEFYQAAPSTALGTDAYRERIGERLETNCAVLVRAQYGLPAGRVRAVCAAQRMLLEQYAATVEARAAFVRETHGDLRPEHICLAPEPVIIDCLEFNRDFRLLDPVDELSFLAMECEHLGDPRVGQVFLDAYRQLTRDLPPAALITFYQGVWAMLRARICVWHLDDPAVRDRAKWSARALDYLALAEAYVRKLE
jgi:aminoglycoside phosphotransferase family enzyme